MALAKKEQIKLRLQEGLDVDYLQRLYKQACYAFGEPWTKQMSGTTSSTGDFPDFPDIVVKQLEIGSSRRIIVHQLIALSRLTHTHPLPQFPQVQNKLHAEIRKQFFVERWHGDGYADGEWHLHTKRAILDGISLGVGFVQIGLVTNPQTGLQRVNIRHIPAWQIIFDRHAKDPVSARWCCIQHLVDVDDAVAVYGDSVASNAVTLYNNANGTHYRAVRVYEYYDVGIGGKEPTSAIMIGSLNAEPYKVGPNVFGCLPIAAFVGTVAPGMDRPIGKVSMQMGTQEALNDLERYTRAVLKRGAPVDIVDANQLDAKDLKLHQAGQPAIHIKRVAVNDQVNPWQRVPAQEVPQAMLVLRDMYERQLNAESGITDFDRGNQLATQRTATEIYALDNRSQASGLADKHNTITFYRRLIEKVLKVASKYDRDPVWIDVEGQNILINNPDEPASHISRFLVEHSRVEVDQDALEYSDHKTDRADRINILLQALPFVQLGAINPNKLAAEILKAMGEQELDEWLTPSQQQQMLMAQQAAAPQGVPGEAPNQQPRAS